MSNFNYKLKSRIEELEAAVASGVMTPGFALARLSLDYIEGRFDENLVAARGVPQKATPVRVSFRKNVEIAPFRHEHAEVTVELNGSSLAEATAVAKDAVDEVLGVKELRTAQEQIENAKRVLKEAAKARAKRGRRENDPALEDALRWDED